MTILLYYTDTLSAIFFSGYRRTVKGHAFLVSSLAYGAIDKREEDVVESIQSQTFAVRNYAVKSLI